MYNPNLHPERFDSYAQGDCDGDNCNVDSSMDTASRGDYVEYEAFEDLRDAYNELKDFYDKVKEALP